MSPRHQKAASKIIRIGTRGSPLALRQARIVVRLLRKKDPRLQIKEVIIKTSGDKFVSAGTQFNKGLFVKEIEEALLSHRVDIAVHSLKDVPAKLPGDLQLTAFLKREDCGDIFVSVKYKNLKSLPLGAVIGTSSPRRKAQLLAARPDIKIVPLRGNVATRLRKMKDGECDATILAAAGLKRLGLFNKLKRPERLKQFIPATGQGIICIETRTKDAKLNEWLRCHLNHGQTEKSASSERAFLKTVGGDCHTPIAAYATRVGRNIKLEGFASSFDGKEVLKKTLTGKDPVKVGKKLGRKFVELGARKIIGLFRPLAGKRVLLTSLRRSSGGHLEKFQMAGAEVIHLPMIEISAPSDGGKALDFAIRKLHVYDWIVFTSQNAVDSFAMRHPHRDVPKVAAVGPATAQRLHAAGFRVNLMPKEYSSKGMAMEFKKISMAGKRVLFPRAKEGLDTLAIALRKRGAVVDIVEAYRTVPARVNVKKWRREFNARPPDITVFSSPSAAKSFREKNLWKKN